MKTFKLKDVINLEDGTILEDIKHNISFAKCSNGLIQNTFSHVLIPFDSTVFDKTTFKLSKSNQEYLSLIQARMYLQGKLNNMYDIKITENTNDALLKIYITLLFAVNEVLKERYDDSYESM